jgi:hypothetical protein
MNESIEELRCRLNGETGKLGWNELERHFARGVLIRVAPGLDLVEVAAAMVRDDKTAVESWLANGRIARASAEDAVAWNARRPFFWAVVTAPWVLVQEIMQ